MISRNILCLSFLLGGMSAAQDLVQIGGRAFSKTSSKKNHPPLELPKSDPAGADILRFDNGDLIHGKFGGLNGGILWERPDMDRPLRVKRDGIRQIVFNGGQPGIHTSKTSHVSLINGDQIPGEIKSLDEKHLILDSPVLGKIQIPREQLKALTPNPFDGQLSYAGPFTSDGWILLTYPELEKKKDEAEDNEEDQKEEEEVEVEKSQPSWVYSGAAFFSARDQAPLVRQTELPEKGRLQFEVSWKGRLSLSVALHADFTRPMLPEAAPEEDKENDDADEETNSEEEDQEDEENKDEEAAILEYETLWDQKEGDALQEITWLDRDNSGPSYTFGSCYLLNLGTYPRLQRCEFDGNGKPQISYIEGVRNSRNLSENGTVKIDIRFDRAKKLFILYINGQYSTQWTDPRDFKELGRSLGFSSSGNCRVRISDIYVTSWNGMRDTALSMEHEERDVALLTNGTDRFSGSLTKIEQGLAHLKTSYAEMTIPLQEISTMKLNKSSMDDSESDHYDWKEDSPSILLFKPLGRLSLVPNDADNTTINGYSPYLGNLKVNLNSATLLRFNDESSDVTDWFDDL